MNKGLVEIVESANGETKLKLIKPVKQAATANPLSGEGLDIDDANEQQGEACVHLCISTISIGA